MRQQPNSNKRAIAAEHQNVCLFCPILTQQLSCLRQSALVLLCLQCAARCGYLHRLERAASRQTRGHSNVVLRRCAVRQQVMQTSLPCNKNRLIRHQPRWVSRCTRLCCCDLHLPPMTAQVTITSMCMCTWKAVPEFSACSSVCAPQ